LTHGPLAVPTAIDWLLQATEAIAEGHSHGIVHRDLKPANLFLSRLPDGTASIKVIDFGLSKVTRAGTRTDAKELTQPNDVMGSPSYMAPEQLRASGHVDPRTDQWALGAVLYELITARSPFGGGSMPETCAAVLLQAPVAIAALQEGVPAAVERAVLRCLEKEQDARYRNVAELAAALAPYGSASARASCEPRFRQSRPALISHARRPGSRRLHGIVRERTQPCARLGPRQHPISPAPGEGTRPSTRFVTVTGALTNGRSL
jgi:serine/threonine-protein kinase